MTEQGFQTLLADFFRVAGAAEVQALPGVGRCRYFGLDIALHYDHGTNPSTIHGYIDLGTVGPARQREVFRSLLRRNPCFRREHSAVLGLDSESDRIVLVARISFDHTLSGRRMAAILTHWIQDVFVLRLAKPAVRVGLGKARTLRRPS